MTHSFTIAILCYNEEGAVAAVVREAAEVLEKLTSGEKQLLVINDGSTDQSAKVLSELQREIPLLEVVHQQNKGIGGATHAAHHHANGALIYVISGDGQADLKELRCEELTRLTPDEFLLFQRKRKVDYGWFRMLLTSANKIANRILFGYSVDDINWNKVVWKTQLNQIAPTLDSVLIDSEIVLKLLKAGFRMKTVSTQSFSRVAGKAKGAGFTSVFKALSEIVQLWKNVRKQT